MADAGCCNLGPRSSRRRTRRPDPVRWVVVQGCGGAPGPGGEAGEEEGGGGAGAHREPAPRRAVPVGAGRAAAALHGPLPRRPARRVNSGRGHGAVTISASRMRGAALWPCSNGGVYVARLLCQARPRPHRLRPSVASARTASRPPAPTPTAFQHRHSSSARPRARIPSPRTGPPPPCGQIPTGRDLELTAECDAPAPPWLPRPSAGPRFRSSDGTGSRSSSSSGSGPRRRSSACDGRRDEAGAAEGGVMGLGEAAV